MDKVCRENKKRNRVLFPSFSVDRLMVTGILLTSHGGCNNSHLRREVDAAGPRNTC